MKIVAIPTVGSYCEVEIPAPKKLIKVAPYPTSPPSVPIQFLY